MQPRAREPKAEMPAAARGADTSGTVLVDRLGAAGQVLGRGAASMAAMTCWRVRVAIDGIIFDRGCGRRRLQRALINAAAPTSLKRRPPWTHAG